MSIQRREVKLSHGATKFLEAGDGEPLILLHGVPFWTGGDYWQANLPTLEEHFHVYAPDLVGWGDGDRLPVEYSFAYLADFVREFQDALGLSSAHIVGHSMGGWVAAVFAYESPDRVRTLTLVNAGGMATRTLSSMREFEPPSEDDILQNLKQTTRLSDTKAQSAAVRVYARTQTEGALDAYRMILHHMNDPLHRSRYNLQRRLPHISCPTLIVWGTDDAVNDISFGRQMQNGIARSKLVELPCGHYCPSELPDAFNQTVTTFIQSTHNM